jgi:predicted GNAT family N-acyltransferase
MSVAIGRADWRRDSEALREVRRRVFIEEQGISREDEWDGQDAGAVHFLATQDGVPVGTARLLPSGQIGRMAVLAELRGKGIGRQLLDAAVEAARDAGLHEVFLHAQRTAEGFYAAAGFHARGPGFMEAGIPHVDMNLPLGVPYVPVEVPGPEAADAVGTTPVRATPRRSSVQACDGERALAAGAAAVAAAARRMVRIRSVRLAPPIFDQPDLEATLSALARRHAQCQVRILVSDPQAFAGSGHRLLMLARRLSSNVLMRTPRGPVSESLELQPAVLIADQSALWLQPHTNAAVGWYDLEGSAHARNRALEFDQLWDRATEHPELRELRL